MSKVHPYIFGVAWAACLTWPHQGHAQEFSTNSVPPVSSETAQAVRGLLQKSSDDIDQGDLEDALRKADAALQLDSHNSAAYELRGSIYIQKKLWDRAEHDYSSALEIDPSVVAFKYQMAEVKFLQKAFDAARPRFLALQQDPALGDLATYKVFLCDLLAGHDDLAAQDLAQVNKAKKKPSYYYCNGAWNWSHRKSNEANAFFSSAATIYSDQINNLYRSSLKELSDLYGSASTAPIVTFTAKNQIPYNRVRAFVQDDGLRVSTSNGWITIPFAQLPDDISVFPIDVRIQIAAKRQNFPDAAGIALISFTTKNGKHYDQVKWSMDDAGLRVLTPDGRITIPIGQLPNDLSVFPAELREQVMAARQFTPDTAPGTPLLTFITKKGKHYDQVKWAMTDSGLRALTSDGWMTVPLGQLPDNLSAFPPGLRDQITIRRQSTPDVTTESPLLTFMTKKGKHYDQVKWAMTDSGLRVLTSDGWTIIPFGQLPDDLSVFPPGLRDQISAKLKAPSTEGKSTPATP